MNANAVVLGAALALLSTSAASAQESSRLSAEYLRLATPLIHWPRGLEPREPPEPGPEALPRPLPPGPRERPPPPRPSRSPVRPDDCGASMSVRSPPV